MSDITQIDATMRSRVGKGSARAARRAGRVPPLFMAIKKHRLPLRWKSVWYGKLFTNRAFLAAC